MLSIPETKSRLRIPASLGVALIAISLLIYGAWWSLAAPVSKATTITDRIALADLRQTVRGYGRLLPRESLRVAAPVAGRIVRIPAASGAAVDAGDVLFVLVSSDLDDMLHGAELDLLQSRAEYQSTVARMERETLSAQSELALARSHQALSEQELESRTLLMEQRTLARLDYARAQAALNDATLRVQLADSSQRTLVRVHEAEREAASLRLRRAEQAHARLLRESDALVIRAPVSGTVNLLSDELEPGIPISRDQPLAQISDPSQLYAEVYVSASQASRLQPGQRVSLDLRGESFSGRLRRVHPRVQDNQVRCEVDLEGALPSLARANIDVMAEVVVAERIGVASLTTPAGVAEGDRTLVLQVRDGEDFRSTTVRVGMVSPERMEILDDLPLGTEVRLSSQSATDSRRRALSP